MTQVHQKRFDELLTQVDAIISAKRSEYDETIGEARFEIDGASLVEWSVKTLNLLAKSCGKDSEHYSSFTQNQTFGGYDTNLDVLQRLKAVFLAAKEDFEGGYLQDARSLVQAEVFDSELAQAAELLKNNYLSAAAVVAGVVLETTLRELCDRDSIPHGKLDKMNADLAKKGVYNRLLQKRITALADIRNSAAHGKPNEFNESDVRDMIRDVERFVTDNLPS